MTTNVQQLDELIQQLADQIANCDDDLLLDELIAAHSNMRARRGELPDSEQSAPDASSNPRTPQEARGLPEQCQMPPTLALAFLERFPAVGRHYFLLRNWDREANNGRGIVDRETARELLQGVCSWRRTLQILKQGDGYAWDLAGDDIRLKSPAKVSIALGAGYLRGNDVIVDTANLTGGIQRVRAVLYSTLHATRKLKDDQQPAPMQRATLESITGVKPRSQYTYDKLAGTRVYKNVHLGEDWNDVEGRQQAAINHGYIFPVYDRKKRKRVIGRPLPNSFASQLVTVRYGRKKRVNREIRDHLLQNEGTGKGDQDPRLTIFNHDENGALTNFNKNPDRDHYWRAGSRTLPTAKRDCKLHGVNAWYAVEGVAV